VRIAVLDDYQDVARGYADWAALPDADVDFVHEHLGPDALVERIGAASVVVAMRERTPFGADVLARLPELRLLVTTGMRNAAIDVAAARARGVVVCGTAMHPHPTPELTWAMILDFVRPVRAYDAALRQGRWQDSVSGELSGRTLGIVGLGRLGTRLARFGAAFGMTVQSWSPHLTAERAAQHGASAVGKHELFATSDVVTLHMPLAEGTRGIVGRDELRAMRPDALFVNTSRAGLVDQDALREAIEGGWFARAALDVFDIEPLPVDHWLRASARTLLTPHMGYVTEAGLRLAYSEAVEDVAAFLAGAPIRLIDG